MSGVHAPEEWQADPKNVKRVMVVSLGEYFVFEHKDPRGVPLRIIERNELPYECDLYEVAGLAFANKCGAVWMLDAVPLTFDADDSTYTWHELSAKGAVCGVVAQKRGEDGKGQGLPLAIYALQVNDPWGLAGALPRPYAVDNATRARALAEGIALAAFTLDQQLRFSPSYTGISMLRRVLADYEQDKDARLAAEDARAGRDHEKYTIPQPSPETRALCAEHPAHPIQWRTPDLTVLAAALPRGVESFTVHIYDRNMSYPSSAREVPVGDPIKTTEYIAGKPGLYLVYEVFTPEESAVWLWEPELRHKLKCEEKVYHVLDGYYWPEKIDLRQWHNRIWNAHEVCYGMAQADSVAGKIADSIVKKAGRATVGRLNQGKGRAVVSEEQALRDELHIRAYESDDSGDLTGNVEVDAQLGRDDLVWPHAWNTIISNSNERLEHAVWKYAAGDTLGMYVDQLYCLFEHPELDGSPLTRGGWKHGGAFQVPVRDLEELNAMGAQELVKRFAKYQRQQGMRD